MRRKPKYAVKNMALKRIGSERYGDIVQSLNVKETSSGGSKPGINGNTPQVSLYHVMIKI